MKPAGSVKPEITLADKAVETEKLDDVLYHIQGSRFTHLRGVIHKSYIFQNYAYLISVKYSLGRSERLEDPFIYLNLPTIFGMIN